MWPRRDRCQGRGPVCIDSSSYFSRFPFTTVCLNTNSVGSVHAVSRARLRDVRHAHVRIRFQSSRGDGTGAGRKPDAHAVRPAARRGIDKRRASDVEQIVLVTLEQRDPAIIDGDRPRAFEAGRDVLKSQCR